MISPIVQHLLKDEQADDGDDVGVVPEVKCKSTIKP